jgi:CRISPR-associated protein Csm3
MKLSKVEKIEGTIILLTGLHIGGGNEEIHIGGTDSPVIKNPITQQPYIPGSSIKGKMRSLLEWEAGLVGITDGKPVSFEHLKNTNIPDIDAAKNIIRLFGGAPMPGTDADLLKEIGPTRLAFWDCSLKEDWVDMMDKRNLLLTETKMENTIDRIKGTAEHPRNTERVPAGAKFDFAVSVRVHNDEDLLDMLLRGLKLLEITGLGGSGSRGYGKIAINLNKKEYQQRLEQFNLEETA